MADRRDLRQRVIALIEIGFSASEAGRRCHVSLRINFKIMGSVKGTIMDQELDTKLTGFPVPSARGL